MKVTDLDGRTLAGLEFAVDAGRWELEPATIARIQGALAARAETRSDFRLQWFQGPRKIQTDRFVLPDEDRVQICAPTQPAPLPPAGDGGAEPPPDDIRAECREKFREWNDSIKTRLGHDRYLAMLFGPNAQIFEENKDYAVAGDLIYTAVCQRSGAPPPVVKFTKCDLQSAIPKSPEGAAAVAPQKAGEVVRIEFPTRQCFGTAAEVKVTLGAVSETHPIGLYERYRYTLQVATVNTDQHVHTFGLRKDGEQNRVLDKGPIDDGPEYVASIVLYALPRYLGNWLRRTRQGNLEGLEALATRTYHGRDVVNDHAALDRLGLVFGAGLDKPRDRFVAGLSFELVPGVNAVGVYERARLKELAGVADDDVFAGTAEEIPTRDVWSGKVVFGVSLDLRYVTGLFKRGS